MISIGHYGFHRFPLLEFPVLVDAFLDENSFQGREVEQFLYLAELDFQLAAQEITGAVGAVAKQFADCKESGLLVLDDTAVGGDGHLAVCERV